MSVKHILVSSLRSGPWIAFLLAAPATGQWSQPTPVTSPSARAHLRLAHDARRDRIVLYGGATQANGAPATYLADTWEYDGSNWSLRNASSPPGARRDFGLVYDARRGRVVLFGGRLAAGLSDDTWEYDGTTWSAPTLGTKPPARADSQLAYDATRGRVVLFGGGGAGGPLADTWEYDGTAWSQRSPASSPAARSIVDLTYDPLRRVTVLYGGQLAGGSASNETWEWNGTTWSQRVGTSAGARYRTAMAALPDGDVFLFGGHNGLVHQAAGSLWGANAWRASPFVDLPTPRTAHHLVFMASRNRVVMFGGFENGSVVLDQTWEYRPAVPSYQTDGYAAGTAPSCVAAGDVDGDLDVDLIAANQGSNDITLRRNGGTGDFTSAATLALPPGSLGVSALALADLDGDLARDDAAVVCTDAHRVVLLDNVGGAPSATVIDLSPTLRRPVHVAAGPLDAGAIADVVVALEGEFLAGGNGVAVSFDRSASLVTLAGGNAMRAVKVCLADLDAQNGLDLVVLGRRTVDGDDEVQLFRNTGSGTGAARLAFAGALTLTGSRIGNGLCCDDLDGDGRPEIVVARGTLFPAEMQVQVLRHTGGGALDVGDYTPCQPQRVNASFVSDIACLDVRSDSLAGFIARRDLAVTDAAGDTVAILHAFDGATFQGRTDLPTNHVAPFAAAVADFDRDGTDDLAVASRGSAQILVTRCDPPPVLQTFGNGCPGTGGRVPQVSAVGHAGVGGAFGVGLANARIVTPAMLFLAFAQATAPLGAGCTAYVGSPVTTFLLFTDVTGFSLFGIAVPGNATLVGLDVFCQWVVFDPAGALSGLALSDALRVQIGD